MMSIRMLGLRLLLQALPARADGGHRRQDQERHPGGRLATAGHRPGAAPDRARQSRPERRPILSAAGSEGLPLRRTLHIEGGHGAGCVSPDLSLGPTNWTNSGNRELLLRPQEDLRVEGLRFENFNGTIRFGSREIPSHSAAQTLQLLNNSFIGGLGEIIVGLQEGPGAAPSRVPVKNNLSHDRSRLAGCVLRLAGSNIAGGNDELIASNNTIAHNPRPGGNGLCISHVGRVELDNNIVCANPGIDRGSCESADTGLFSLTVSNADDAGTGSPREAITQASATPGPNPIRFARHPAADGRARIRRRFHAIADRRLQPRRGVECARSPRAGARALSEPPGAASPSPLHSACADWLQSQRGSPTCRPC